MNSEYKLEFKRIIVKKLSMVKRAFSKIPRGLGLVEFAMNSK
jgi:hypothetical protein